MQPQWDCRPKPASRLVNRKNTPLFPCEPRTRAACGCPTGQTPKPGTHHIGLPAKYQPASKVTAQCKAPLTTPAALNRALYLDKTRTNCRGGERKLLLRHMARSLYCRAVLHNAISRQDSQFGTCRCVLPRVDSADWGVLPSATRATPRALRPAAQGSRRRRPSQSPDIANMAERMMPQVLSAAQKRYTSAIKAEISLVKYRTALPAPRLRGHPSP